MQIDQRHVTTVNLHDSRARDFVLLQDGRGYKLSCVSREDVVHILLSGQDLLKLRQELVKYETKELKPEPVKPDVKREPRLEPRVVTEPRESCAVGQPYHFQWTTMDWLSFN